MRRFRKTPHPLRNHLIIQPLTTIPGKAWPVAYQKVLVSYFNAGPICLSRSGKPSLPSCERPDADGHSFPVRHQADSVSKYLCPMGCPIFNHLSPANRTRLIVYLNAGFSDMKFWYIPQTLAA